MATSVKQMLEAANAAVPKITPAQAKEMIAKGNTLVVDVRDGTEVAASGKVAGAVHVSRGCWNSAPIRNCRRMTRISPRTRMSFFIAAPAAARRWPASCSRIWATRKSTISAASRIGPNSGGEVEK